jgi:hypothetical protein
MDRPSLELIVKFCGIGRVKCNYLIQSQLCQTFEQIGYGFIFFPLFCNIYLHCLDNFIAQSLTCMYVQKNTRVAVLGYSVKNCLGLENSKVLQVYGRFKKSEYSQMGEIFLNKTIF